MMYKYAHGLPKQLDTDGKLIPKHDASAAFWHLVDSHYFSDFLHFHFNEKYITKTTALDVFDAVRHRKGLMDHVDLSGLTYLD